MKLTIVLLALAAACATSPRTPEATSDCGELTSALAPAGTEVRTAPDGNSPAVAVLKSSTRLCVATDSQGFGFRRARLADGRSGFVADSDLQ